MSDQTKYIFKSNSAIHTPTRIKRRTAMKSNQAIYSPIVVVYPRFSVYLRIKVIVQEQTLGGVWYLAKCRLNCRPERNTLEHLVFVRTDE